MVSFLRPLLEYPIIAQQLRIQWVSCMLDPVWTIGRASPVGALSGVCYHWARVIEA